MNRVKVIKKFYEKDLKNKNLDDYEKLHWESEWSQKIRFEMLLSNLSIDNKSILDVGSGLGNLYEYIKEKGLNVKYTGVDILKPMVKEASKRHPEADFYSYNIFKEHPYRENSFDIVYSSGIFNLNLGNNKKFLKDAIEVFLKLSQKHIAFNLLHIDSKKKEKKFYYYEPSDIVKMIEKSHVNISKTEIHEHYLNNDFTIICEKNI
jgi:SAM-dependent methyltransferase